MCVSVCVSVCVCVCVCVCVGLCVCSPAGVPRYLRVPPDRGAVCGGQPQRRASTLRQRHLAVSVPVRVHCARVCECI